MTHWHLHYPATPQGLDGHTVYANGDGTYNIYRDADNKYSGTVYQRYKGYGEPCTDPDCTAEQTPPEPDN